MKKRKKPCVSAIIKNKEGKILVQDHVKLDAITLPGGKVENDEDIHDTLERELKEELGIIVKRSIQFGNEVEMGVLEYPAGSGQYMNFTQTFFGITEYDGEIENKEPNKHKRILWVEPHEVHELGRPISHVLQHILDNPDSYCI